MDVCTLGLPCFLLLLSALFPVTVSSIQKCVPQELPDTVIDINTAVARGARFTDPLSVMSAEECLSACCMQLDMGGDLDCNFLVFDARKGRGQQNCYIFHCPTQDSCPLVPSLGVLSYSLWSEPSGMENPDPDRGPQSPKTSDRSKVQTPPRKTSAESGQLYPNFKKDSAAIASQGSAKHYAKEQPADSSRSITAQLLRLADRIDQHLERMESEDDVRVHHPTPTAAIIPATRTAAPRLRGEVKNIPTKVVKPDYKKHEDLKIYPPTAAATLAGTASSKASPRLGTAAPPPVPRTKVSPLLPLATPQDVSEVKKAHHADFKTPRNESAANNGAPKEADHPLPHTDVRAITTIPTKHPQMATHPAPLQTSPWKGMKPNTKTDHQPSVGNEDKTPVTPPPAPQEPPRIAGSAQSGGALPSLEDKSGLVAALVFGVLFLMVLIGLVSRKVSEARRRHRYTKLDYLINGMYVDT